MKNLVALIILLITSLRADNISFSGMVEQSDYWNSEDYFIDLDLTGVLQLGYGWNFRDNQQINFLAEYSPTSYNAGISWHHLIRPYEDSISGISIGPQLMFKSRDIDWKNSLLGINLFGTADQIKYAEGNIKSNYLTPSISVNFDKYIYNLGFRLYGDIGYNFLISEKRTLKYNQAPGKITENSMQSDLSVTFGFGLLYNLPNFRAIKSDFE